MCKKPFPPGIKIHLLNFNFEFRSCDQNCIGREKNKDGSVEFKHVTYVDVAEKQGFSTE